MATFLLVHGAWHGAWCWDDVAAILRERGHEVVTPTLTGLGDRRHELDRSVGLDRHIDDVATSITDSGSEPMVVVGHSYGGMVATAAAAQAAGSVASLVIVDGFLPRTGERAIDLLPAHAAEVYRGSAAQDGEGWKVPPRPLERLGVTDPSVIAAVSTLLTPHPLQTYLDPAPLGGENLASGAYVLCDGWSSPFIPMAERAEGWGWRVQRIPADHEVPLTAPALLTDALEDVLAAQPSADEHRTL